MKKRLKATELTTRAIILAAGINSRLRNYITDVPKSLLPVGSSTILGRQISLLMESGIKKEDIFIVSGYKDEKIRMIHDNLLLNEIYRQTDNAYSLHIALAHIKKLSGVQPDDEIFVLDCDLVYNRNLIPQIIKSNLKNLLVTRKEHLQGFSTEEIVLADRKGRIDKISRFCDENAKNPAKMAPEQFVYTGILKMSNSTAKELYNLLSEKQCWNKWYTAALVDLFGTLEFYNFPLPEHSFCMDVDTKEDFERITIIMKEENE